MTAAWRARSRFLARNPLVIKNAGWLPVREPLCSRASPFPSYGRSDGASTAGGYAEEWGKIPVVEPVALNRYATCEAEAPVKAMARRLRRLEHQLSPTDGKPTLLLFACNAAQELALDNDACKQILRETGCLSTGPVGVIDLTSIPDGLNAEEMERYLRENAAEICAFRPAPTA